MGKCCRKDMIEKENQICIFGEWTVKTSRWDAQISFYNKNPQ